MAEQSEQNLDNVMAAEAPASMPEPAPASAQAPAAEAEAVEPAPRRRGRPRKKPVEADAAEKPKRTTRRGRPRKTAEPDAEASAKSAEPAAPAEELSPEVIQARALAQISQASVVRRERREDAERAALLEGAEPAEKKPARRRGRKSKAQLAAEAEAARAAEAAASDASGSGESAPAPEVAAPAGDDAQTAEETAEKKPARRRGRKSKAQKEQEAAEAAAKAASEEAAVEGSADGAHHDAPAPAETTDTKADAADAAPADGASHDKRASRQQRAERENRRTHEKRRDDRYERTSRRAEARNQRNQARNGKRGRYNVPNEPTLTREECAAMKVAELRARGAELGLEVAGVKKAELVGMVYEAAAKAEGFRQVSGILEIGNEGFGYVRAKGYFPSRDDIFVSANMIRAAGLRPGDYVTGTSRPARPGDKYPGLAKLESVNGTDPETARKRPKFSDLTPIYPNERLRMEHGKDSITGRAIDIVSPVGKGQRGLIVSPPKAGKTTVLKKICQSIAANNPEVHLICLLVDERPEEVTDMERSIRGEVVASTFDMPADNHTRVAELVIERATRIVEGGGDVVVVLDSITRLARAYNLAAPASGRILSGGVDSAALYPPKRFLGAARNIENGGSLTILASALIDTGSKMDEVIFEEFKGTGNMELKLDRDLADRRIFPAIDPVASGTRNEDLLIDESMRPFVWGIRRILANMNNTERAAAAFIKGLKSTGSNEEFLIRSAKRAADHPDVL